MWQSIASDWESETRISILNVERQGRDPYHWSSSNGSRSVKLPIWSAGVYPVKQQHQFTGVVAHGNGKVSDWKLRQENERRMGVIKNGQWNNGQSRWLALHHLL